ncbi:MAG: adenylate/guanylate cyclase domain-containing protein [Myxococcota bacterium]
MPFQLAVEGHQTRKVVALRPGTNLVGRSARVDVVLDAGLVSRRHAKLVVDEQGTVNVYDLDSHNGVFVNGEKIRSRAVNLGDKIYVGGFCLTLENVGAQEPQDALAVDGSLGRIKVTEKLLTAVDAALRGETSAFVDREAQMRHVAVVSRAVQMLSQDASVGEFRQRALDLLRDLMGGITAALIVVGEKDQLDVRQVSADTKMEPSISWAVARKTVAELTAFCSREQSADMELAESQSITGPTALLSVPVAADARGPALGAVQITRPFEPGGFADHEVDLAVAIGHAMAVYEPAGRTAGRASAPEAPASGGMNPEALRAALLKAMPDELADRVLSLAQGQPAALVTPSAGEQVVVFYDLHGFDAWSAQQSPSEVARVVGGLSTTAAGVASAFGGRLEQAVGSGGFMRFWDGQPDEVAEAAVRAVLDLRARMQAVLGDHARSLRLRAGADHGPVMAGVFGDGARATYTLVGAPARVAERIAEMAGGGELYITAALRAALVQKAGWRIIALGPHALRGRPEAVDLFRVDGAPVGSA